MTTMFGKGCYCCLCFSPITEETCSVINGQKVDTCIECENHDRNQYQTVLHKARLRIKELENEIKLMLSLQGKR